MISFRSVVLLLLLAVSLPTHADSELVEFTPRSGVTLKTMVIEPETKPKTVLISYPGGRGTIELRSFFGSPSINKYKANFLVRTRDLFVKNGYVVVLPDVPSDHKKLKYKYRLSDDQIVDTTTLVDYFQNKYNLPVWIMGTSASSLTAAYAGSKLTKKIAGIVLTASVTRMKESWYVYDDFPEGTASANLEDITVPVIISSNREDACNLSPSEDSELIRERLVNSPRVEVKYYSGGDVPQSKDCNALSRHGFLGLEDQVVSDIISFIEG